jgi:ABC-type nitrate/sulfonate/bicarbonate transport system substrate-binding protein
MPAITLLAASDNWSVVSLTVHFPYALMVRNDLQIEDIIDLKGKTVGVPFGSGPQPTLYRWLEAAGLAINKDVKVKNILPNEIAEAISSRKIDAVMAWEPTMTVLKKDNSARVFREAVGVGFMCMSNDFIDNYPDLVDRFIQSWKEALLFSAKNKLKTVEWFSADSRIPVDILADISIVDDNLKSDKLEDINIVLTEQDINKNQRKADFAYQQNLISKKLDIKKRIIWKFMSPNRD